MISCQLARERLSPQYYSVLHSTTPVLLCTTKYYSGTNSVLSTTPVLLCTTQIYTSTTLYYKVLLQYYSVLQSTTPALLLVLQSTHLQGAKHQRHQMLCLPRKVTLMIDPRHIWNVIYNAQSNRTHPPTSPNTAPATQNDSHEWCPSHMKRHLQCADQQVSSTNVTKYCACHEKRISSLIRVTYETSFTMRGATSIALQRHQILRLPRKKSLVFDPRHIWNVIYNARSNKHHPPTSPNAAPATKNDTHHWLSSPNAAPATKSDTPTSPNTAPATKSDTPRSPNAAPATKNDAHHWLPWQCNVIYNARSNRHHPPTSPNTAPATQNYTPKSKKNLPKTADASIPMRGRSEHDPNMIRPWTRHLAPARSPRLLFTLRRRILYWKLQHFALRLSTQISPNTAPATKSDTPTSPNTAPATKSDTPTSPNAAPATKSDTPTSPNTAPAMKSDTELLLDCTLTCYLTWIVSLLSCYLTELSERLLHCCYLTELLLYWAVTLLSCCFTELLFYWAVALLNCYFTELLLYWTVTLLSCYFTELLLYWAVTLLSCCFTELLLYWAVALLNCYCIFKSP